MKIITIIATTNNNKTIEITNDWLMICFYWILANLIIFDKIQIFVES